MNLSAFCAATAAALWLFSACTQATGMLPESSVVIVEQDDGEGAINLQNTDSFPVLLL
ncbi:TPA: fimbria/pilus chaperone family protein, partial [Providencia alcalifaciens]